MQRVFVITDDIFEKAAQVYAPAQFSLSSMYSRGEGVKMDPAKAALWMRKAAEQGFPDMRHDL